MKKRPLTEVLPKQGLVYSESQFLGHINCKPKVLPLKSVTLEQLEDLEDRCKANFMELGWGVPPEGRPTGSTWKMTLQRMLPEESKFTDSLPPMKVVASTAFSEIESCIQDVQRQLDALESDSPVRIASFQDGDASWTAAFNLDGDDDCSRLEASSWAAVPSSHPFCALCEGGLGVVCSTSLCATCQEPCEGEGWGCDACAFYLCDACHGIAQHLEPDMLRKWFD
eukprot:EG_transcript_14581